ncbi:MAG: IclR family transcriptional regulator [bacterium]
MNTHTSYPVQSLIKSLVIMEVLAESKTGMSLTDISTQANIKKGATRRLLSTLVHEGFVDMDGSKVLYRLSLKPFIIARKILNNVSVTKVVSPFLEKLAHESGESVRFIVHDLENACLVVCDEVVSDKLIRPRSHLGVSHSFSSSAAGKMVLATMSDDDLKRFVNEKGQKLIFGDGKYSFANLKEDLKVPRKNGFSYAMSDDSDSTCSIAAPIYDEYCRLVGIIELSAPEFRCSKKLVSRYGKKVREVALAASKRLGYIEE